MTADTEMRIVASDLKLEHVGDAAHYKPPSGLVDDCPVTVLLEGSADSAGTAGKIAGVLERAFFDDPLFAYVMPNPSRRSRQLAWWMSCAVRYGLAHGWVYATSPPVGGTAIWLGPETPTASLVGLARAGLSAGPFRLGIRGLIRVLQAAAERNYLHRREPDRHWYLMILGVEPEKQGRGIGSALMQPVLKQADRDGLTCYLETMTAKNAAFYERRGFEVVTEGQFGPRLPYWAMRRHPR